MIIYSWINYPGHGRSKMYGINEYEKSYLRQRKSMLGTEESNNKSDRMNAYSMIYKNNKKLKFKKTSLECIKLCSFENRHIGVHVDWSTRKDNILTKLQ